jgi:hypothetical protein
MLQFGYEVSLKKAETFQVLMAWSPGGDTIERYKTHQWVNPLISS